MIKIERSDLIKAIITAQDKDNITAYNELLSIYYLMLDHEDLGNNFLNEVKIPSKISNDSKEMLMECVF